MNFFKFLIGVMLRSRFFSVSKPSLIVIGAVIFGAVVSLQAQTSPVKVVGYNQTLVLLSDGTVVGWGVVDDGQLGPKAAIPADARHAAKIVSIKLPRKAVDICALEDTSVALLDDGTVVGWGKFVKSETPVKAANLSDIVKISGGGKSGLALRRDGTVYGFKDGSFNYQQMPGLQNIKEISTTGGYGLALDASGEVWSWANFDTIINRGVLGREGDPFQVGKVEGLTSVVSISAQGWVSTAVKSNGTVWVWGSNNSAQFANGRKADVPNRGAASEVVTEPQQVAGIANAAALAKGTGDVTLVLLKDGTARGWGNSQTGETGNGGGDNGYVMKPAVTKIFNVKAIFVLGRNIYAVKNDNTFWKWGAGSDFGFPYIKKSTFVPTLFALN